MKKKIVAIVAVFAVIALMSVAYGCGKSNLEPETPVITSVSAAETSEANFNFEKIYCEVINSDNVLTIFHETTTDTLFLNHDGYNAGGITQVMDPETGLPLTYTVWQEKYSS